VLRVTSPGLVQEPKPEATPERKEVPTVREYAVVFMSHYLSNQKPSERVSKESILKGQLLPYFGDLRLDQIRQANVDAFATYCSDNCGRRPCRVAPVALLAMMGTRGRRGANPVTAVEV